MTASAEISWPPSRGGCRVRRQPTPGGAETVIDTERRTSFQLQRSTMSLAHQPCGRPRFIDLDGESPYGHSLSGAWASRQACQISGRSRPRSGTASPAARAQARTSPVVGSGAPARSPCRGHASPDAFGDGGFGGGPGVRGGEVAVGPFLGQLGGSRRRRSARRASGPAARPARRRPAPGRTQVELEDLRVAVLDDDGRAGQRGQLAERRSAACRWSGWTSRSGSDLRSTAATSCAVDGDAVVAARQRAA